MRDAHFHPDPVNNLPKPNDNNHLALERNGKVFEIEELSLSSLIDVLIILRKRAFRAKKRTSTSSDYQKTETERIMRLSKKLMTCTADQPEQASSGAQEMQIDGSGNQEDSSTKPTPKVSTHGPRMSGREVWKASKRGIQLRRAPSTTVWHQRAAGKPQRRR
ncbi:hypothetical protein PCANC_02741 [Puccinia coronata f. sp. avenae]|uniref:DUF2423 domain-containing protein n=1 Tax=Puccinia coronata f. sp. avenae TaxID=200324 RepID=A0A2N5UIG9_9BASI|nr:hypothetical protein PCASD_10667 [Puccinia coronata f. sp. avenae]PLW54994.1 hypothetical protein PCANC_02741 [Puccinia coronata f. sp. avenae]